MRGDGDTVMCCVQLSSLPTSDPEQAGCLWNDDGTPRVSTGPPDPPPPPPTGALPAFGPAVLKLATPPWLVALGRKVFFPRIIGNEFYYSSDHSPGAGYIGHGTFDHIEGTWFDDGGSIHSGVNQRETPHPVDDPIHGRRNLYVHDNVSSVGQQAARLLTSPNGLPPFTDHGEVGPPAHHNGYGQYWPELAQWRGFHLMLGGAYSIRGYSTSADGESFSLQRLWFPQQNHVVGHGKVLGLPFVFEWDGARYVLGAIRSWVGTTAGPVERFVAVRVDPETLRPIGNALLTLLVPDAGVVPSEVSLTVVNGTPYLVFAARDAQGQAAIYLSKGTSTPPPSEQFVYPTLADGELYRAPNAQVLFAWDAVATDLPSALVKACPSGADTSAHLPGVGYRLSGTETTSPGPSLWVYGAQTVDIAAHESVEFAITGVRSFPTDTGQITFGFHAGTTTFVAPTVTLAWSLPAGRLNLAKVGQGWLLNTAVERLHSIPLNYNADAASRNWTRTQPLTLAVRVSHFGQRLSLLIDGQTTYSRDIASLGMTWDAPVRPYLLYAFGAEMFMTGMSLRVFD